MHKLFSIPFLMCNFYRKFVSFIIVWHLVSQFMAWGKDLDDPQELDIQRQKRQTSKTITVLSYKDLNDDIWNQILSFLPLHSVAAFYRNPVSKYFLSLIESKFFDFTKNPVTTDWQLFCSSPLTPNILTRIHLDIPPDSVFKDWSKVPLQTIKTLSLCYKSLPDFAMRDLFNGLNNNQCLEQLALKRMSNVKKDFKQLDISAFSTWMDGHTSLVTLDLINCYIVSLLQDPNIFGSLQKHTNLESLVVENVSLSPSYVQSIEKSFSSKTLHKLRFISFKGSLLGIAQQPTNLLFSSLKRLKIETLNISKNTFLDDIIHDFLLVDHTGDVITTTLKSIDFMGSKSSSPNSFKNLKHFPNLEKIDLSDNKMTAFSDVVETMANLKNLRLLLLKSCSFQNTDTPHLKKILAEIPMLQYVDLSKNDFSTGLQWITDALQERLKFVDKSDLSQIILSNCKIGTKSLISFFSALNDIPPLTSLDISQNNLDGGGFGPILADNTTLKKLTMVNVFNEPGEPHYKSQNKENMGIFIRQNTRLSTLHIGASFAESVDQDLYDFLNTFHLNQSIKIFQITNGYFIDQIHQTLFDSFSLMNQLTSLDLSYTNIGRTDASSLIVKNFIESNTTLEKLDLRSNRVSDANKEILKKARRPLLELLMS